MKTLDTKRLLLRQWSIEDIEDFHELMCNPACMIGGWKPSSCREDSLNILKSYIETDGIFAIILKKAGRLSVLSKYIRIITGANIMQK